MEDHVQLQKKGLKATHPRLKILDIFEHSEKRHLSAEDVYKIMLNSREEIGLATIYRVLTQFEQAGLLIKHHFENDKANKAIFELNEQSHHDHIVCLQCGNVEEFQNPEIEKLQALHGASANINFKKDASIMGGMFLKVGDETLDLSIKGRVKKLVNQLNF
jgi:Fur family ferric uptake transcriptional regulator